MSLRFLTAGESHGAALIGILDGMPSGVSITKDDFERIMQRRWIGYGRGNRKKIEPDRVTVISGMLNGKTTGAPIGLLIENQDFKNTTGELSPYPTSKKASPITVLKPGHADLPGIVKYNLDDIRPIRERSSARETAIKTALSIPPKNLLNKLGVQVVAFVKSIGGIEGNISKSISANELISSLERKSSSFITPDTKIEDQWCKAIDIAANEQKTLGGVIELRVYNCPIGIGSNSQNNTKLEAKLTSVLMGLPAVKAVEIGHGIASSCSSEVMLDKIEYSKVNGFTRPTNFAGGIEGGMSNGETITICIFMKQIPGNAIKSSIDFKTKKIVKADHYRSDTAAVSALSVVCEAVINIELASLLLNFIGGNDMQTIQKRWLDLKEFQRNF